MRLIKICLTLVVGVLFSTLLFAQNTQDYSVSFNSGRFVPQQNIKGITKNAALFTQSRFNNKNYVAIQFTKLPSQNDKNALSNAGITLLEYLPTNTYLAVVSNEANLSALQAGTARAIFSLSAAQKTMPGFMQLQFPQHAVKTAGMVDITITTFEKVSAAEISSTLLSLNATVIEEVAAFRNISLRIPQANFAALLSLPFISWAEPVEAPSKIENEPGRTLHRVNILNDGVRNLKGDGINIGIWDGGQINLNHLDFSPAGRVTTVRAGAVSDHATHVAGTITGKGLVNQAARGMAPNAKLFSYDFNTTIPAEMAVEIPGKNLLVSSHSYGSTGTPNCSLNDPLATYSTTSRNTDINLNNNASHLHVHSSGNSGGVCSGGFMTITGSGKSAKNNLVVSNVTTTEAISGSSSRGPVHDGRIKPEISAMGTNVFSTWIPNNSYATISGTSMATPGVSGTAALLYQRYKELNSGANAQAALIKNIICNAAEDIGNAGPDYTFGFGRLNALASVEILEENRYALNTVATGASNDITITVPAGAVKLRAMLTWNDPAATANAATALVNDLDLTVVNGANTTLPWIMNKNTPSALATRGIDNYSNIEQVTIDNPTAGTYTLKVSGTSVPVNGSQAYTLTWIIDQEYIKVLYPNGGENLNPGNATGVNVQYITWDNAGITGNQTVEYSVNDGATWTTLSTTVPANVRRQIWNPIPTVSTSTALVRVSSGSVTDVSDARFNIAATPASVTLAGSCVPGSVSISWTAVANATHYDIYKLDAATGSYVIEAANVTSTTYTVNGLAVGTTVYFSHVAKNNASGIVSQRSIASSIVVPAGLGSTGTITGATSICGATSNVVYNTPAVTGASSYTWTVPTGATIVSGLGTNNITVNYSAAAVSGIVTVQPVAGTCQGTLASLAISVSSAVIAAPVSGGNQSVTHCPPNAIPTLTATATVTAGNNLVWYDMATGGTVVVNPVLNAYGSVTYYAAAVNTTTGCQSSTRTAVSLTITQAPAPTIVAIGSLTFCQGGSVQLTVPTAAAGYTWSNGATTQSINVTTSGNYSAIINQGNGCIGTSNTITVTVNPLPVITVTAGGPLTFCQGGSVQLTATAGNSYVWSNGATTQSITVSTAGNYSVTVNQGNSCVNTSAPVTVVVNPLPAVTITAGGPTSFCQGGSVQLTASAGTSYAWSNGATTQSINVTNSGSYTVTVQNGCTNTSAATVVTVNPLPVVTLSAAPYTKLFPGLVTTLTATASNATSYAWFKNGVLLHTVTGATHMVGIDDLGDYRVTVSGAGGCSNTSSIVNIADSAVAKLFVYPNPTNGQFQVSYHNDANSKYVITVFDSKGGRAFSRSYDLAIPYQRMAIDMRRNAAGIYSIILSDRSGKKIATGSVVIQ